MKTCLSKILFILFCNTLIAFHIQAAEKLPSLAEMWVVHIDLKDSADFEKALKEHTKFRLEKGDPRQWQIYAPITGDQFGVYYIRYCCIEWKDNDAYSAWSSKNKTLENWRKTAGKYANKLEHYFSALDFKNGQWPETDPGFKFFEVISFDPKPGMGAKIEERKAEISQAAVAMKWPYNWSWSWRIGGESQLSLVLPYTSYAEMAEPETSFTEALGKHFNDADKARNMMQEWSSYFDSTQSFIVALREDLSMPQK